MTTDGAFAPLTGVRVIDFTRVLAGPYATMLLAELGADVVKVEGAPGGDETRGWGPPFVDESSAYFHAVNRGKRSVVLDLKADAGRTAADRLVAGADVVVENFRPGVAERLGIGAERLRARHPRLVHVSITGFGTQGPLSGHAGTEVVVEAESGLMDITGDPGGPPARFGIAMVDIATGLSAVVGLLGALLERERTGRGRHIRASLYATAISSLGTIIAADATGDAAARPRRWGSGHPSIVPYRAFAAADGHVVVGATSDGMWQRLCAALDLAAAARRPAWATNRGRVAEREAVESTVAAAVRARTREDVVTRLRHHGALAAAVRSPADAARSEQAREQVVRDDGAVHCRSPLFANATLPLGPAPGLGEHDAQVLDPPAVAPEPASGPDAR